MGFNPSQSNSPVKMDLDDDDDDTPAPSLDKPLSILSLGDEQRIWTATNDQEEGHSIWQISKYATHRRYNCAT